MNRYITALGVDQGIANCGYSVIRYCCETNNIKLLRVGTIETKPSKLLGERIEDIHGFISNLITEYNVEMMACEKLFFSPKRKQGERNKSASIVYTNMITGVLYLISSQKGIIIEDYVPGTVKKYVAGSGRATKEEVLSALQKISGIEVVKTEHESDAIAIAITLVRKKLEELNNPEQEIKKVKKTRKKKEEKTEKISIEETVKKKTRTKKGKEE